MNQGEAAESIVRMSLNGMEMTVKVAGTGIKGAIALMYALYKNNKQLSGKTSLTNMLKSGKELKVFSIKEKNLEQFIKQAKKYGVLYSALLDKKGKNLDGMVDIMVRAEDAPKINRIVERFNLTTFDEAKLKAEINKDKADKMVKEAKEKGVDVKDINSSTFVDELLGRSVTKEKLDPINPNIAETGKGSLSEHSLKNKKNLEVSKEERPSVKAELNKLKKEEKDKTRGNANEKTSKRKKDKETTKHTQPIRKKKKKTFERGV